MDWNALREGSRRSWPKGLGCALALALLLSIVSFHLQDPTFTNLRMPSGGVANWLGLPGALLGGSLLELLGTAALGAPLLLLHWVLVRGGRPEGYRYAGAGGCLLLALAGLHGLAAPLGDPALDAPGLAGWAVRHWAELTLGPWGAAAALAFIALSSLRHVLYAPAVRTVAREARRAGAQGVTTSAQGAGGVALRYARLLVGGARALSHGMQQGLDRTAHTMLDTPQRVRGRLGALRAWRPGFTHVGAGGFGGATARTVRGAVWADASDDEGDTFAEWLSRPEYAEPPAAPELTAAPQPAPPEAEPAPVAPEPLAPVKPPGIARSAAAPETKSEREAALAARLSETQEPEPAPAEREGLSDEEEAQALLERAVQGISHDFENADAQAAWRERFQRYARNLDLDWQEQLWRREDEPRAEDEEPAEPEP